MKMSFHSFFSLLCYFWWIVSYHSYCFTNEYNVFLFHQWEFDRTTIFADNSNISSVQNLIFQMKIHHSFCVPHHLSQDLPSVSWGSLSPVNFEKQTARVSDKASEDYLHFNMFEMLPMVNMHNPENTHNDYVCICLLGSDVPKLGCQGFGGSSLLQQKGSVFFTDFDFLLGCLVHKDNKVNFCDF